MRISALIFVALLSLAQVGEAAIIFTLSPTTQTITQGDVGQFELSVRSTVAGGERVDSLDAAVNSNAPNSLFTAASQSFLLNNGAVDRSVPRQAFISNFLAGGITIGETNTLFARLFLSTANVVPATYSMSLSDLAANSPTVAGLQVQNGGPVSFTVQAVPEPTSIALVGLVVSGYCVRRYRRKLIGSKV